MKNKLMYGGVSNIMSEKYIRLKISRAPLEKRVFIKSNLLDYELIIKEIVKFRRDFNLKKDLTLGFRLYFKSRSIYVPIDNKKEYLEVVRDFRRFLEIERRSYRAFKNRIKKEV